MSLDDVWVLRREPFLRLFGDAGADRASGALPRHQELRARYSDLFVTLAGMEPKSVAFISHRWVTPHQPDPEGEQLRQVRVAARLCGARARTTVDAQVVSVLRAHPELAFVWYDFWCLPQRAADGSDDRTEEEKAYFRHQLGNIKWLNVQTTFVPLWGGDYLQRAWCYAEVPSSTCWACGFLALFAGFPCPFFSRVGHPSLCVLLPWGCLRFCGGATRCLLWRA